MRISNKILQKITNPIYLELIKLNLISNINLSLIAKRTRNKKINVFQDMKEKVIFLEKYITSGKFYETQKNNTPVIVKRKKINLTKLEDANRRLYQFKKYLRKKNILDYGCSTGDFLAKINNTKNKFGVEVNISNINYIRKHLPKINVKNNIRLFNIKFDVITLFHVLEHLPYQVKTLKEIKTKLKSSGKLIIEVPHANDFLISKLNHEAFKNFTLWEQHLILHTEKSLKKILIKSGFKKVKIIFFQRYGLDNHLGWILDNKPGGHIRYKSIFSDKINKEYKSKLSKIKCSDTLIAIASLK